MCGAVVIITTICHRKSKGHLGIVARLDLCEQFPRPLRFSKISALTEAMVKRLEIDDAKDKIALQVSQANYRMQEAWKTYEMTRANLEKAEENLRIAQVAFTEGMATTDEVLTAQTAWVKANSENIDAQIDLRMCDVYLSKVTGDLNWNTTH